MRCAWCGQTDLERDYHDAHWGRPLSDGRALFEMLCLEGAQAGLSWLTILKKRENYRLAFDGFDPEKMAAYGPAKIASLLGDPGIVRNRLKVGAFIANARAYLALAATGTGFSDFVWGIVGGTTVRNSWKTLGEIPAKTPESEALSRALAKLGFKFVGPTICYAFMQAVGLVDDHVASCWRRTGRGAP
ncbi:MAG: DNA-3-methyladenine glycosylase I [Desulfovibrionaceae bacterium]|nr:DNA-3-methyladenine glycosylase I [Desulfovibrionaceae bacterium]MBF0513493.1 DNA-3-methyladenine glycosylase I [Desulfovibrionaceae bacterium]